MEYLLEPSSTTDDDERPVHAMCSLLRPTDSHVTVRVVNVGKVDEEMPKGTVVGMACPEFEGKLQHTHGTTTDKEVHVSGFQIDKELLPGKQAEIQQIVN